MSIHARSLKMATFATAAILALAACGSGEGSSADSSTRSQMRSFQADNGTVEIPVNSKRIVTIGSPSLILGIGVKPVGMNYEKGVAEDWLTDEQKKIQSAAVDVGQATNLDYEKVVSLKPDLIVIHIPKGPWESKRLDEQRLKAIAPTAYIQIDNVKWKEQGARIADMTGVGSTFAKDKAEYDALVKKVADKNKKVIEANTFAIVNKWGTGGDFSVEYSGSYCSAYAVEAGLKIEGPPKPGLLSENFPMERLTDLSKFSAIIYPLGPDGKPLKAFQPVLDSNVWKALPQVANKHVEGVKCNVALTYPSKITGLNSLDEALGRLSAAR